MTRAPRNRRQRKISRHSSGQARVTLGCNVHHLGRCRSPEAQRRYVERACRTFAQHGGDVLVGRRNKDLLVTWRDRIAEDHQQTRTTINKKQASVKHMLAWAAERDRIPEHVSHAMNPVRPLRRGEDGGRPERGKPRRAVA
ncbi:MAG: hypothetical protein ACON4Z_15515 [Planctomycetota bacterium]